MNATVFPEDLDKLDVLTVLGNVSSGNALLHLHWRSYPSISKSGHIIIGLVILVFGFIATLGNIAVIYAVSRFRSLRTSSNLMVLQLAFVDLFMTLTNFPMMFTSSFSGEWLFGNTGCKIHGFGGALTGFVSINTITVISMERYFIICSKRTLIRHHTSVKRLLIVSVTTWIYSLLWAIAPWIGWGSYILEGSATSCTFDFFTRTTSNRSYVVCIMVFCFTIQLCIICFSYTCIFAKVFHHERNFVFFNERVHIRSNCKRNYKYKRSHVQTAKIVLLIVIVFCVSWTPYAIIALIGEFGNAEVITPIVSTIPGLLAKFSTVINPLIYAVVHPKFKNRFKQNIMQCRSLLSQTPIATDTKNDTSRHVRGALQHTSSLIELHTFITG